MSVISRGAFRVSATATADELVCSRRSVLIALMAGIPLAVWGCHKPIEVPFSTKIAQDLPVTVKWTVNGETVNDATTVFKGSPGAAILVTGELLAKTGTSFARYPRGTFIAGGFEMPPLAMPKNSEKPYHDKPDDLHLFIISYLAYVPGEGSEEEPVDACGAFNQIATFDQKTLRFSGGMLTPNKPGRYALRLCASFKPEKECKSDKDRQRIPEMSSMKVLAESTIQLE